MSQFTIALSGLSEEDIAQVQTALDMPDSDWSLVDGVEADLLMVDIDSVWGHMDWLRATANGVRTIAYSDQAEVRNADLMLHKPLDPEALNTLLGNLDSTSAIDGESYVVDVAQDIPQEGLILDGREDDFGSQVDAIEPDPAAGTIPLIAEPAADSVPDHHAAATAEPGEHLSLVARARAAADLAPVSHTEAEARVTAGSNAIDVLAQTPKSEPPRSSVSGETIGSALLAGVISHPIRIENHGTTLQIDPQRGGYYAQAMLKPLAALLGMPLSAAQTLDAHALEQLHLSPALPLTRLLWFAGLCATPGELAAPLGRKSVYHLTRWPQIEREFPRHFRIATALMKQPDTVDAVAEAAKAPVADVIDFINAYYMAGFVNTDAAADDADGSMLSRLRRPFVR